jgi:hypothetical protein
LFCGNKVELIDCKSHLTFFKSVPAPNACFSCFIVRN